MANAYSQIHFLRLKMSVRTKNVARPLCVDVALPLPVGGVYTYAVPKGWAAQVRVGSRVLVPVRDRRTTGFVVKLKREGNGNRLKEIGDVLDAGPLFDSVLLRLTQWVADYYLCPWGEVLKAALPAGIHLESRRKIRLKEPYSDRLLEKADRLVAEGSRILRAVFEKGELRFDKLKQLVGEEGVSVAVEELERKGYIEVQKSVGPPRVKTLYERWIVLSQPRPLSEHQIQQLKKRAPRQGSCLDLLLKAEGHTMSASELRSRYGIDGPVLQRMRTAGLIRFVEREMVRDPYRGVPIEKARDFVPTAEQSEALRRVERAVRSRAFRVFLLHGVTGSGKTQVYIRAIREVVKRGRKAIVLIPEIALTPQTVARFRGHFADRVAVLHSRLSLGERYDIWRRIQGGAFDIVIGARSAVYAPVRRLGLIVVDEEHESAYKQSDSVPRYHARDVAIVRARLSKAVILLGTATPSLESYHNATTGKYARCALPYRIDHRPLPPVTVVDMCEERKAGNWDIFSNLLREKIEQRWAKGEQVILLQNRRGFSSYIQCEQCGYVAKCRSCNVTLTYHSAEHALRCHYCDARHPAPSLCPKCSGHRLRYRGVGTQRIEKEVQKLFPGIKILRMDVDTTRRKGAHGRILKLFERGEVDVLLGTQMVAKGLDFPRVTLVGVIDADVGLNLPDFRASERTFHLLTQVAGRAGRSELGGEVVVQTFSPDNPAVAFARCHDYASFSKRELEQRRELRYPPFSRLVSILTQGREEEEVRNRAEELAHGIRASLEKGADSFVRVLGPAPAPLTKIMGNYRWQIILKGDDPRLFKECLRAGLSSLSSDQSSKRVRVTVDVDPVDML
ncbi:MAG: primosomal protein N' [bacterium]